MKQERLTTNQIPTEELNIKTHVRLLVSLGAVKAVPDSCSAYRP